MLFMVIEHVRDGGAGPGEANVAIVSWCNATNRLRVGPSWEVYGHWDADTATVAHRRVLFAAAGRDAAPSMTQPDSRVTIHMAASVDGFIARKDGRVDWLETSDEFVGGDTMDPGFVEAFLKTIDCCVMGSRTYETALRFESQGLVWAYGDKPTFVLTSRELPRTRDKLSS